ncbi:hypothetical protein M885DRAFT_321031 [Pelagophyceae sp. CCMP2097]|nr:hypothetical protein M885DRAFT_321031 [Pelagophyceae sp. CCMP2097]
MMDAGDEERPLRRRRMSAENRDYEFHELKTHWKEKSAAETALGAPRRPFVRVDANAGAARRRSQGPLVKPPRLDASLMLGADALPRLGSPCVKPAAARDAAVRAAAVEMRSPAAHTHPKKDVETPKAAAASGWAVELSNTPEPTPCDDASTPLPPAPPTSPEDEAAFEKLVAEARLSDFDIVARLSKLAQSSEKPAAAPWSEKPATGASPAGRAAGAAAMPSLFAARLASHYFTSPAPSSRDEADDEADCASPPARAAPPARTPAPPMGTPPAADSPPPPPTCAATPYCPGSAAFSPTPYSLADSDLGAHFRHSRSPPPPAASPGTEVAEMLAAGEARCAAAAAACARAVADAAACRRQAAEDRAAAAEAAAAAAADGAAAARRLEADVEALSERLATAQRERDVAETRAAAADGAAVARHLEADDEALSERLASAQRERDAAETRAAAAEAALGLERAACGELVSVAERARDAAGRREALEAARAAEGRLAQHAVVAALRASSMAALERERSLRRAAVDRERDSVVAKATTQFNEAKALYVTLKTHAAIQEARLGIIADARAAADAAGDAAVRRGDA